MFLKRLQETWLQLLERVPVQPWPKTCPSVSSISEPMSKDLRPRAMSSRLLTLVGVPCCFGAIFPCNAGVRPNLKYVEQSITSTLGPPQIQRPSVDMIVLSSVVLSQCPLEYRSCIVCCLWSRDLLIPLAHPNHRRWDLATSSEHGNGTSLLRQCKGHSEEPGRPMSREADPATCAEPDEPV